MKTEDSAIGSHGQTQTYDTTITYDIPDPVVDRNGDARNQSLLIKH